MSDELKRTPGPTFNEGDLAQNAERKLTEHDERNAALKRYMQQRLAHNNRAAELVQSAILKVKVPTDTEYAEWWNEHHALDRVEKVLFGQFGAEIMARVQDQIKGEA